MVRPLFALPILLLASCSAPSLQQRPHSIAANPFPPAPARQISTPRPAAVEAIIFALASWDPPPAGETVLGYYLYIGERSHQYAGRIQMDLKFHLHGVCEVPVLINHSKTFVALSAYNAVTESPLTDEQEWPPPALTVPGAHDP